MSGRPKIGDLMNDFVKATWRAVRLERNPFPQSNAI